MGNRYDVGRYINDGRCGHCSDGSVRVVVDDVGRFGEAVGKTFAIGMVVCRVCGK